MHPSGTRRRLLALKSPRYGLTDGDVLPYRIDQLRSHGFDLLWTDAQASGLMGVLARWSERRTPPWSQAWLTRKERRSASATLAMFESEGHALALWRRLRGRRSPPLYIVGCWLADLARRGGLRATAYRWLYRAVDGVIVFSSNQRTTLIDLLDLAPDRVHVVPFGIDLDEVAAIPTCLGGRVVAAGRDLGRDWPTLVEAVQGTDWGLDLITRPHQVAALDLPPNVDFHGAVGRAEYLGRLAAASVVVIPTFVREYPTGQTVLLEAMALGKACVVTDTPAMREYVADGVTALLVPPGDPEALRRAVDRLLAEMRLSERLGRAASAWAAQHGSSERMWRQVAAILP